MNKEAVKNSSDLELMNTLKSLRGRECQAIAEIVLYLAEVEKRGIYRDAGYSSLFTYCTDCLGYSEGGASRRVRAARCFLMTPVVYEQLKKGEITLCSLAEVAPIVTAENQELVLGSIKGVSKREAQRIAEAFGAVKASKRSTIRARKVATTPPAVVAVYGITAAGGVGVTEERYSFSFEVSSEVEGLYQEAKILMGHLKPEEVFEKLLRDFVAKKKAAPKVVRRMPIVKAADPEKSLKRSRAIPSATRRAVLTRDEHRCTFTSPEGKRCGERMHLEVDHIHPFAKGGDHSLQNLRVLCQAHNMLHAERCFGRDFIRNSTSGSKT